MGRRLQKPRSQLPTESKSNGSGEGSRPQRRQSAYPRSGQPYQQHRGVCCTRRGVLPHSKSTKVLRNIISSQLRKPTFRASVNGSNSCARSGKGHLFPAAGWKTSSGRASVRSKDVSSSNARSWLEMKAVNCCRYWTITQSDELRGSATLPADCGDLSLSREVSVRISFSSSNATLMSSVLETFFTQCASYRTRTCLKLAFPSLSPQWAGKLRPEGSRFRSWLEEMSAVGRNSSRSRRPGIDPQPIGSALPHPIGTTSAAAWKFSRSRLGIDPQPLGSTLPHPIGTTSAAGWIFSRSRLENNSLQRTYYECVALSLRF